MAGRPPTPTNIKHINGSAARHPERINKREPKPHKAGITPPRWMTDKAEREAYRTVAKILKDMNVLTNADTLAVAQLATYWAQWREMKERVSLEVWESENGYRAIDPLFNSLIKVGEKVTSLLKEFGMTPVSRVKVVSVDDAPVDPMEGFLERVK